MVIRRQLVMAAYGHSVVYNSHGVVAGQRSAGKCGFNRLTGR